MIQTNEPGKEPKEKNHTANTWLTVIIIALPLAFIIFLFLSKRTADNSLLKAKKIAPSQRPVTFLRRVYLQVDKCDSVDVLSDGSICIYTSDPGQDSTPVSLKTYEDNIKRFCTSPYRDFIIVTLKSK